MNNKEKVFRTLVLIVVFIATVLIVNLINNTGVGNVTAEMEQPTLPLVYVNYQDVQINQLNGYVNDVDITLLRDTITPLDKEKTIELWIDQNSKKVDSVRYELRSISNNSLVEEDNISDLKEEDGYKKLDITLRTDVVQAQEYMLVIDLQRNDKSIAKYYTRIIYEKSMHAKEILDTVISFDNSIFDGSNASAVGGKLEPDSTGNNEDLSFIDIHSNYETVTWAGMSPMKITQSVPRIVEIDTNFACVELNYVIVSNIDGSSRNYLVKERYRVRWVDESTIYLVDYDRQQEEIFQISNVDTTNNRFRLGIVDDDNFEYKATDDQEKVAFVEGGQLWYYDYASTTITRVFGFWQDIYTDIRTMNTNNEIDIITLDKKGNILFTVYGYMNRGTHEGELGIAVYRYSASNSRLEELSFMSSDKPYDMLKENASKLIYMNDNNLYYYMDDSLCCMNLDTKEVTEITYNVPADLIAVSDDKKYVAYANADTPEETTSITLMNLDTGETTIFDAASDENIKALGFVDNDLIYGVASKNDILVRKDGSVAFPMKTINISNSKKNLIMEYNKSGAFVTDITVKGHVVFLDRVKAASGDYEATDSDFITYKEDKDTKISFMSKYSEVYYNQYYMVFPSNIYVKTKPRLVITEESIDNNSKLVELESKKKDKRYYLFANGVYVGSYAGSQEAIREGNDMSGLVTSSDGEILWRKSTLDDYNTVASDIGIYNVTESSDTLKACIYMMAHYEGQVMDISKIDGDEEDIEDEITKDIGKTGVNLSGNLIDVGLYYLCSDVPFIVKYTDGYVLVTSFNASAVRYIDPLQEEDVKVDREEFEANMAAQGNVMYSYVPGYDK